MASYPKIELYSLKALTTDIVYTIFTNEIDNVISFYIMELKFSTQSLKVSTIHQKDPSFTLSMADA